MRIRETRNRDTRTNYQQRGGKTEFGTSVNNKRMKNINKN